MTPEKWIAALQQGDRRALAKALTIIESQHPADEAQACALVERLPLSVPTSLRIGITGPPGAGKSSLIEALGVSYLSLYPENRIGVLSIDPSSPLSQGSILADKTRMPELSRHPRAFIRPAPSGQFLGGTTRHSQEALQLFEATGCNWILVETVGTGQSEHLIRHLVDLVVVLQVPSSGDALQAMKKGILEIADLIAVNKADGDTLQAAQTFASELSHAVASHIPVLQLSTQQPNSVQALLQKVLQLDTQKASVRAEKRLSQRTAYFPIELETYVMQHLAQSSKFVALQQSYATHIQTQSIHPWRACEAIFRELFV